MKVTYLSHSGFAVELSSATLLFDYYKGQIPDFPADKPLFVFASHSHGDHFVPQVFDLAKHHPQVLYIFSHDIWMMRKKHTRAGVPEESFAAAVYMRAHETQHFLPGITVTTLRSTDMGVAFLVECDGLQIYHAGDLHWWAWPGDTKQNINNMTANYQREISHLYDLLTAQSLATVSAASHDADILSSDVSTDLPLLDLAFLPLDGRLEENYALGLEYFLHKIPVRHVFPMHFWDNYKVISDFLKSYDPTDHENFQTANNTRSIVHSIAQEGETWSL